MIKLDAEEIINDINDGKNIIYYEQREIQGILDFTVLGISDGQKSSCEIQVISALNFKDCVFKGKIITYTSCDDITCETIFLEDVSFEGSIFKDDVIFINTTFSKTANFKDANFEKDAIFKKTKFKNTANFKNTNFTDKIDFKGVVFENKINPKGSRISREDKEYFKHYIANKVINGDIILENKVISKIENLLETGKIEEARGKLRSIENPALEDKVKYLIDKYIHNSIKDLIDERLFDNALEEAQSIYSDTTRHHTINYIDSELKKHIQKHIQRGEFEFVKQWIEKMSGVDLKQGIITEIDYELANGAKELAMNEQFEEALIEAEIISNHLLKEKVLYEIDCIKTETEIQIDLYGNKENIKGNSNNSVKSVENDVAEFEISFYDGKTDDIDVEVNDYIKNNIEELIDKELMAKVSYYTGKKDYKKALSEAETITQDALRYQSVDFVYEKQIEELVKSKHIDEARNIADKIKSDDIKKKVFVLINSNEIH